MSSKTALRQYRAARVAEFAFQQRLERIKWEEEVLKPELERVVVEMGSTLEIPEFSIVDAD